MDYSPPGSSVHGILQARMLEWVAIPSPGDFPNSGIKPGSPVFQADSLPSQPQGKPQSSIFSPLLTSQLFFFFLFFLFKKISLVIAVGFIHMSSTYHSLYCYFTFCLRTSISCSFVLSKMCHSFYFNMYYKSHSKNLAVFGFK